MSHLGILNAFNHLGVSFIYIEQSPNGVTVRRRNVLRNLLFLGSLVAVCGYFGINRTVDDIHHMVQTVVEIVHLLKYSHNSTVIYVVLCWMCRYYGRLLGLCNEIITVDHAIAGLPVPSGLIAPRNGLLKTLIVLIILLRAFLFAFHVFMQFMFNLSHRVYLVLHCNVVMELAMDLDKLFLLFFAKYLAQRYETLHLMLRNRNSIALKPVCMIFENLLSFKKHLSELFGPLLLALIVETFVACSVHAYLIICLIGTDALIQTLANVCQLVLNLCLFYLMSFFYDAVEAKEAELKNTLKSIQYANLKSQSRDQKDFYDLVNLKLMMDSPKITACGLFEINLQIFYNVFAAIITYIVILFQFRDFEKSP